MKLQSNRQVCYYCGNYIAKTVRELKGGVMTRVRNKEHIIPASQGGSRKAENIIWTCCTCNSRRGTIDHEQYLDTLCRTPDESSRIVLLILYIAHMGTRLYRDTIATVESCTE